MKADAADMMVGRRLTAKWLVPSPPPPQETKPSGRRKHSGDDVTNSSRWRRSACCLLRAFCQHDQHGVEEAGPPPTIQCHEWTSEGASSQKAADQDEVRALAAHCRFYPPRNNIPTCMGDNTIVLLIILWHGI
jgi:hypothetical protein